MYYYSCDNTYMLLQMNLFTIMYFLIEISFGTERVPGGEACAEPAGACQSKIREGFVNSGAEGRFFPAYVTSEQRKRFPCGGYGFRNTL